MLVCFPFCLKDQDLALKTATWISTLNIKNHRFLLIHDYRCNPQQIKSILNPISILSVKDHWDKWPESANQMWCETARYVEHKFNEPWLWLEPDAILLKPDALDILTDAYEKTDRPFMGGFVPRYLDSPDHMSGIAIYPGEIIKHAGMMLMSAGEPCPFDLIAAGDVLKYAMTTDLIQHKWSPPSNPQPPFKSLEDIQNRVTSECVLYHSDKSGSLIDILSGGVESRHAMATVDRPLENATPPSESSASPAQMASRHGNDKTETTGLTNNDQCEAVLPKPTSQPISKLEKLRANAAKAREAKFLKRLNKDQAKKRKIYEKNINKIFEGVKPYKISDLNGQKEHIEALSKLFTSPLAKGRIIKSLKQAPVVKS